MSPQSAARLKTCHHDLIRLVQEVEKHFPLAVLEGYRGQAAQDQAFKDKKSKTPWPQSKHNQLPSRAVDIAFLPIDWNDTKKWYLFGGFVLATAKQLGIKIRWGGDWNGNLDLKDQMFNDLPHFELGE